MRKVILDTNFLINSFLFRIDFLDEIKSLVEEPIEFLTLDSVVREIKKISKSKTKDSGYAKIALDFIKQKNIKMIKSEIKSTDKAILGIANKNTMVATNDTKLRKKLKKLGVKTIYLRARKHLAIS